MMEAGFTNGLVPPGADMVTRKRVPAWERECEALWDAYCEKRDFIIRLHQDCLSNSARTPRLAFIFAAQTKNRWRTFREPNHHYPKNRLNHLRGLVAHVEYVIANPGGLHGPK
jgi:hypothetical protein